MALQLENARLSAALREKTKSAAAEIELHGRFVSTLVHDMTGPIVAAKRATRQLLDQSVAGAKAPAATILESLGRLEEMVAELVDANLIRADRPMPTHLARCELSALASDCADGLCAAFGGRFKVTGDRPVEGIWSPDLLRRALWNLAANAVQFGTRGTPVTIDVRHNEDSAVLTVHNEGPVLPPAELARLIQPFASPQAGRGQPPGWGLGLTLVWGCAEAHGGRVQVESEHGMGTSFKIILPYDARPYSNEQTGE